MKGDVSTVFMHPVALTAWVYLAVSPAVAPHHCSYLVWEILAMPSVMSETFIIILLLLANGVLAMSEIAIVSARKARLQQ